MIRQSLAVCTTWPPEIFADKFPADPGKFMATNIISVLNSYFGAKIIRCNGIELKNNAIGRRLGFKSEIYLFNFE